MRVKSEMSFGNGNVHLRLDALEVVVVVLVEVSSIHIPATMKKTENNSC